jgi:hypothetical protein
MRSLRRGNSSKTRSRSLVEVLPSVIDGAHLQVFEHRHAREDAPALGRLRDRHARDLVGRHAVMSVPSKTMRPSRACGVPQIVIISVDLPAPLAPISVTISP